MVVTEHGSACSVVIFFCCLSDAVSSGRRHLPWCGTGRTPVHGWRRWTRTVLLWEDESIFFFEERRGVRVFRHGLVDKAAEMVDAVTHDQIRGSDGARNVKQFPTSRRARISDHEDFERAVYGSERSSTETHAACVVKKRELFQRYEKALSGDFRTCLKTKGVLR